MSLFKPVSLSSRIHSPIVASQPFPARSNSVARMAAASSAYRLRPLDAFARESTSNASARTARRNVESPWTGPLSGPDQASSYAHSDPERLCDWDDKWRSSKASAADSGAAENSDSAVSPRSARPLPPACLAPRSCRKADVLPCLLRSWHTTRERLLLTGRFRATSAADDGPGSSPPMWVEEEAARPPLGCPPAKRVRGPARYRP
jgi:hypothetical protein